MSRPLPEPVAPERLVDLAKSVIQATKFPFLATSDGDQPRVRPISLLKIDGFTIYFGNLRHYAKTAEIAANPRVELAFLDLSHDQVRVTGVAEIITDPAILNPIWTANPLLRQYLGSPQNPELVVYRIRPDRVRFMREWALEYHEVPID